MDFMNQPLFGPIPVFHAVITGWKLMGSIGALMFALRWFVQFYHSRRAGKPVTPTLFWIMSLVGSTLMLLYFVFSPKQDMVGVISNVFPGVVSAYNLYLVCKISKRYSDEKKATTTTTTAVPSRAPERSLVSEQAAGE